jgi:hypothetical protein
MAARDVACTIGSTSGDHVDERAMLGDDGFRPPAAIAVTKLQCLGENAALRQGLQRLRIPTI